MSMWARRIRRRSSKFSFPENHGFASSVSLGVTRIFSAELTEDGAQRARRLGALWYPSSIPNLQRQIGFVTGGWAIDNGRLGGSS